MLREVISQPAIAQRRSTRAGTQGNIQEKATMLKAARNEITGISKFTTFHSQSVDKLSKLANSCKIKLGNETEAHLAIDRLKAHEIANAAIIEAREKTKSKKNITDSANRFASLDVDSDIELGTNDQTDLSIEGLTDNNGKKKTHMRRLLCLRGEDLKRTSH